MNLPNAELPPPTTHDSQDRSIDEDNHFFQSEHPYRSNADSASDLLYLESQPGVTDVYSVTVSVYGNDNALILDTLGRLGGTARAVVSIDLVAISDQELLEMHQRSVRGVRLDLRTLAKTGTKTDLEARLVLCADRVRDLGWALELDLSLKGVAFIAECVPELGVGVVINDMASPDPDRPVERQAGYHDLLDLLRRGLIWVKISENYQFESLPNLDRYVHSLVETNASRCIWASQWQYGGHRAG